MNVPICNWLPDAVFPSSLMPATTCRQHQSPPFTAQRPGYVFPTILGLVPLATTIVNHATVVEVNGISIYGPERVFRDWAFVFLTTTNRWPISLFPSLSN